MQGALLGLLVFLPLLSQAEPWDHLFSTREWDASLEVTAASIAASSDGSLLVMGQWSGTAAFSPDPSHTVTAQSSTSDVYLLRYRPSGAVDWLLTIGSSKADYGNAVRVDTSDGSCIITGEFSDTITIGVDTFPATWIDVFVVRVSLQGTVEWAQHLHTDQNPFMFGTSVDVIPDPVSGGDAAVFAAGYISGASPPFDLLLRDAVVSAAINSSDAVYVTKLAADTGAHVWTTVLEVTGPASARIDVQSVRANEADGSVVITGALVGTVSCSCECGTAWTISSASDVVSDVYVIRLDSSGRVQWAFAGLASSLRSDTGSAVAWASDGDICLAGALLGKPFVAKLASAAGTVSWLQIMSDRSDSTRAVGSASEVLPSTQSAGCVVSGTFRGSAQLGDALALSSDSNSEDVFAAETTGSGEVVALQGWGREFPDRALGMAQGDGKWFLAGLYAGYTNFGGSDLVATNTFDVFLLRTNAPRLLACPTDIVSNSTVVSWPALPGGVTASCSHAPGSTFPVGDTTVQCEFSESGAAQQRLSCSFLVTVRPVFNGCLVGNGGCDALSVCSWVFRDGVDVVECGSCPQGYTGNGTTGCVDIDECTSNNGGCDGLTQCLNLPGSFACGPCPAGYTGDGSAGCRDINECADGNNGGCPSITTCVNLPGTHACGQCPSGYNTQPLPDSVLVSCIDVDECALGGTDACDPLAECTNTEGGRLCDDCPDGYVGTGDTQCLLPPVAQVDNVTVCLCASQGGSETPAPTPGAVAAAEEARTGVTWLELVLFWVGAVAVCAVFGPWCCPTWVRFLQRKLRVPGDNDGEHDIEKAAGAAAARHAALEDTGGGGLYKEMPNDFRCPLTLMPFSDPVVATDGHTYERSAIRRWLRVKKTSPKTNQDITDMLIPNYVVKSLVQEFLASHPQAAADMASQMGDLGAGGATASSESQGDAAGGGVVAASGAVLSPGAAANERRVQSPADGPPPVRTGRTAAAPHRRTRSRSSHRRDHSRSSTRPAVVASGAGASGSDVGTLRAAQSELAMMERRRERRERRRQLSSGGSGGGGFVARALGRGDGLWQQRLPPQHEEVEEDAEARRERRRRERQIRNRSRDAANGRMPESIEGAAGGELALHEQPQLRSQRQRQARRRPRSRGEGIELERVRSEQGRQAQQRTQTGSSRPQESVSGGSAEAVVVTF